jgi:hypothetical protein
MQTNGYLIIICMVFLVFISGCVQKEALKEGQEILVEGNIVGTDGNGFHTNLHDGGWSWIIVETEKGNISVMKSYSDSYGMLGESKNTTEVTCIAQETGKISIRGIYNRTKISGIAGEKYVDVMPLNCSIPLPTQ